MDIGFIKTVSRFEQVKKLFFSNKTGVRSVAVVDIPGSWEIQNGEKRNASVADRDSSVLYLSQSP